MVERAEKAEKDGLGLEHNDVNLLKLLYLIRYVDDIPSNVENLTILMADDIRTDKLELRKQINKSLDHLMNQNYVSRNGDLYMFLTDEEQDIARDIKNTDVDSATVVSQIGSLIFDDIYSNKKYRYNSKFDFEFNSCVDGQNIGASKNGMTLKFFTAAADPYDVMEHKLLMDSSQDMAICVLSPDSQYYEKLEMAAKIRKYIKQKNINQLAPSVQRIVQDKQSEANRLEKEAKDDIKKAIVDGKYYVHGEVLSLGGTDATNKINDALKYLVEHTYTKLDYIDENFDSDQDIAAVLKGTKAVLEGFEPNKLACDDVLDYLDLRSMQHINVTMYDIQARYSGIPYGWREADIAGVVARLIYNQKVTVKVSGQVIPATDYRMVGYLRKKSEIGNTLVSRRESINPLKLKNAKTFLRDYFNMMDLPGDEDGLFNYIDKNFKDTETILFNIDVEGPMEKDATAVLKVFAKVFYNHLGFYGNDLKLAKLEQFITKKGKMDSFRSAFEEKNGDTWENTRDSYAFFEDDIIDCLVDVLGMSRESAQHWFDGTETVDISIGQLVDEIKDYVNTKPKDFRLLFMIDEAGQYIGTDTNLLLNLQSLIEKLGSTCRGQVWVVATGQEALDDMIKVRTDEFSRIMARFKVRLSLTSSSVGEVIEKRLLSKKDDATDNLEMVYDNNDAVLRNLYAFDTNRKDIRGYKSGDEFVRQFPFVPYQFIVMQNIYNEIRKHGHTGKHQSQGERSMLNGFQESAQFVENKDPILAPGSV